MLPRKIVIYIALLWVVGSVIPLFPEHPLYTLPVLLVYLWACRSYSKHYDKSTKKAKKTRPLTWDDYDY